MGRTRHLITAFVLASASLFPAIGAADDGPTIQQFLRIRTPGVPQMLPDGRLLQRDWPDGVNQLYRVTPKDAARPSYEPDQVTRERLTDYADGLSSFTLSPDGRRVALSYSRGGNENTQIALLATDAPAGTAPTPLLSNPRVQARVNLWLRDGSGLVYSANADSPTDFHLYLHTFADGATRRILAEKGSWGAQDVTADGSRLLIGRYLSASNTEVFELDIASGRRTEITLRPAAGGTAANELVGYAPGERAVYLISDHEGGRARLYQRDLRSGAVRALLPNVTAFELDGAGMNDRRDLFFLVANEDGYASPHLYTLPDWKKLPLPTEEKGLFAAHSSRGDQFVWTLSNARRPGAAFVTTVNRKARRPEDHRTQQLTWTEDQGIDMGQFRLPELVRYRAFDGREIPAFLYLPAGVEKGTPIPFVVIYHGGPEGQHRPGFSATDQFVLTRGMGVLKPNVRGSTGYGREFQMLDDYTKRWDSVRDGVDAAEWLVANGYSEPGRIASMGGSYGGFMSVAVQVEDQERVERGQRKDRLFGAAVNVVGIANLRTFLERTAGYRRELREVEYGPLSDRAFLESVSSLNKVDKIQAPMFIAHGFNDPRVPVEEAFQLAQALKERGREPRVFIAPDEGHGFSKLDNRIYFNERMVQFLKETIGRPPARP